MKKLFVLILMAALVALSLTACSMTGMTKKTTTATEQPAATEAATATEAPAATEEATTEPAAEITTEPAAEATVQAN